MKIGLFGFTFAHENMGCQALTCSLLEIIKNITDESIDVVSFHDEQTLGMIPEMFPTFTFSKCRISLKDPKLLFLREVKQCDVIFDVTYGDGFSDIYFTKSIYKNAIVKMLCESTGVPFVLMPQTYGPFKHKSLELLAGRAIHGATLSYARDLISSEYAGKISHREVKTVTDIAFFLPYNQNITKQKNSIGINVSGLLWQGGFHGKSNQFGMKTDYQQFCRLLIDNCIKKGFNVHLIPHVTKSGNPDRVIPDGDYPACEELHKDFPDTILAPCFDSPYEAKDYISRMEIFIGSRMHATIGAFSSGVITIPFAYSRKFKGLFENFGYPYFVDGTKGSTEINLKQMLEYIDNKEELKESQIISMHRIDELKNAFYEDMKSILDR